MSRAADADPLRTRQVRRTVLRAYIAQPLRMREDANAEDELRHGPYRDRVLIELLQNASDTAGSGGQVSIRLAGNQLSVANTGRPLGAEAVPALTGLRTSTKTGAPGVGRFGVGFAAVLAVADEITVATAQGALTLSATRSAATLARIGGVRELLAERGAGPVLRLPFPSRARPSFGATEVSLRLRDAAARDAVLRQIAALDAGVLLGLDGVDRLEIDVDGQVHVLTVARGEGALVTVDGAATRYALATRTIEPADLDETGIPIEHRGRRRQIRWAVPVSEAGTPLPLPTPTWAHAPTPTDDPIGVGALLIADLPVDESRRRIVPGQVWSQMLPVIAATFADLCGGLPPEPQILDLLPTALAHGERDGELARAIITELAGRPLVPTVRDGRVAPRDGLVLDLPAPAIDLLAEHYAGVVTPAWSGRGPMLAALGVRTLALADVLDDISGAQRPAAFTAALLDALSPWADRPAVREALRALPLPLADGRHVRGVGAAVRLADSVDPTGLPLPIIDPVADHPLLTRLGLPTLGAADALTDPRLIAAIDDCSDDGRYDRDLVGALLRLVAAAENPRGTADLLGDLPLPAEGGQILPAAHLLLPGSPLARLVADDAPFTLLDQGLAASADPATWAAVGVAVDLAPTVLTDLIEGDDADSDVLADFWIRVREQLPDAPGPLRADELETVRDLEWVSPDAWPAALADLRGIRLQPTVAVTDAAGVRHQVRAPVSQFLASAPVIDGQRPGQLRTADAHPLLADLFALAPDWLDEATASWLGVHRDLAESLADATSVADILDALARSQAPLPVTQQLYARCAAAANWPPPPARVRAVVGADLAEVAAVDCVVLDQGHLAPLITGPVIVVAPADAADVAQLLDIPLASDVIDAQVLGQGRRVTVDVPQLGVEVDVHVHEQLRVQVGADTVMVPWWIDGQSRHAAAGAGTSALAAVACAGENWELRHAVALALDGRGRDALLGG